MPKKMLVFDFRNTEEKFFKNVQLEDFDIIFYEESLNEETVNTIPDELKDKTTIVSVFINSELTDKVINQFKNLRLISTRSTGYDHINLKAARDKNAAVINVENYGSSSVVQYTIGLIIALVRNIIPANRFIQMQRGDIDSFVGRDLTKLTLGVVGTGAIGGNMCVVANAMGMNVIAYDIIEKIELTEKCHVKYVDIETLIRESDIITLHLPYTGDNQNLFSAREFKIMKDTAYFINTSRGELVRLTDLYDALINNQIKGAALDVVTCENYSFHCDEISRKISNVPFRCAEEAVTVQKMVKLDNVIVTPHIAYETQDSIDYILEKTVAGIRDFIKGGHEHRII